MKTAKQKHTRTKRDPNAVEVIDTKDFRARVVVDEKDGRNKLKIMSEIWYKHQLQKFKVGEVVTLYISTRKPKRTLAQNAYYWGVYLPLIAKETGQHDIEALHMYFTGKFLTEEIAEVFGQKVRMKKSSTSLSKTGFTEYIMNIEAETGIQAPPTENYYD